MTFLKTTIITIVTFVMLIGATSNPPAITDINQFSFVNMQNDTTISISYTSSGCFHYESGVMMFTPETVAYQGATRIVDFRDMAGLDSYFRGLHAKQDEPGGCTSSTSMTITLNRDSQAVGQMTLRDDFCFHADGMVAPNALKYKLFDKETAEQLTLIQD